MSKKKSLKDEVAALREKKSRAVITFRCEQSLADDLTALADVLEISINRLLVIACERVLKDSK